MDLSSGQAGSQAPVDTSAAAEEGVLFELDIEGGDEPGAGAEAGAPEERGPAPQFPGAPAAPGSQPGTASLEQRLADYEARTLAAERRANEAYAAVAPWLREVSARMGAGQQPQAPTREFLLNDPSAGTQDLLSYIDSQNQQLLTHAQQVMRMDAARIASQSMMRGRLSSDVCPEGWSYDQVVSKYCQPIYERNPHMREIAAMIAPENPAQAEYWLGVLLKFDQLSQGDPVRMVQNLSAALDGQQGRQTLEQVNRAARKGAARIASAQATGRHQGPKRTVGVEELQQMSDREFDLLDQQLTGGL